MSQPFLLVPWIPPLARPLSNLNRQVRHSSQHAPDAQASEQVQLEFKRLAHEAGVKGARITVQRVMADGYKKVIHEAEACIRTAVAKAT